MKIKPFTLAEVEYTSHRLAKELMYWDEPIPEFKTRFSGILESCLEVPFGKFGGRQFYKGLTGKAAALFYLMIKNHPFQNGNKRIAVTTLLLFLDKNGKWLRIDTQELYNFAKWVAASNPRLKEATIAATEQFFKVYMVDRIG